MEAKTIEVRDSGTFIPALAVRLDPYNEGDRYLLARAGFGIRPDEQERYVLLIRLEGMEVRYDPMSWGSRTMQVAHYYVVDHFADLKHGQVVDVQFILGETEGPKVSERERSPL